MGHKIGALGPNELSAFLCNLLLIDEALCEIGQRADYLLMLPCASYQIRKIAGCACAGNTGNDFPRRRFQSKPLVSDPGMHHGTCVTHVPWCMSGSLTCGDGENVPGIPCACAPAMLRIWQEAHWWICIWKQSSRKKLCKLWVSKNDVIVNGL